MTQASTSTSFVRSIDTDTGAYQVSWHTTAEAFSSDLWARCFPPPCEGQWWYRAFEGAKLDDQFTFFYAGIQRGGETVGIVPAFRMDLGLEIVLPDEIAPFALWLGKTFPSLRYQRTLFIGSPCGEETTIGVVPGVALAEVLPALNAAVEAKAAELKSHMIVWKDIRDHDIPAFETIKRKAQLFTTPSFPGTEIHKLPANFDGYLKMLPSQKRWKLKKKLKDSRAAIEVEASVIQHPSEAELAEMWPLFWQTYEKATTRFETLNPAFFKLLADVDSTYFILLRRTSNRKLVAFMLCYLEAGCATNKFIGIDYTLGDRTFLYFRLFEEFMVWATAMKATWLRTGQTGYQAKLELGHELVPLTNFARNRNWVMNQISALVGKSITWSSLDPNLKLYVEAEKRKAEKRGEVGAK